MEILKNVNLQRFISLVIATIMIVVIIVLPFGLPLAAFFYRSLIKPYRPVEVERKFKNQNFFQEYLWNLSDFFI